MAGKGRLGYARLEEDIIKGTGEQIIPCVNVWVSACVGKDGEIDNANVQSVKDKCNKLTQSLPEEEEQDLGPTDTLFKALDLPEYSGRIRSYGKGVFKKRLYAPRSNSTQAQVNNLYAITSVLAKKVENLQANEITGRQQPEKMVERQQPEEVLERPQPNQTQQSAKDSYNHVDIDSILKGISSINIYLGFPSLRLVVRGKLHNTEGDMVHGIKLPLGYDKVSIEVPLISYAPLPIYVE
ncbi:hypothetical protein TSUD_257830 [Trifolium subterraneum]|uniref:Uncharacterized protein n=1 Tax=Trifolium subterraneum TaxID=3900 RepID=A0A2Z6N108_TRISU|nr:hypothetical protein TSUD_257830 [Trifolium subterraneum]